MKRLSALFLTLSLLLSGCAFAVQEPDPTTEDPFAFTMATLPIGRFDYYSLTEWPLNAQLSDAKRQEIKKAWSDHEGIDHTGHTDYFSNCVCDLVWCGSWKGYEILVDLDRPVDRIQLEIPDDSDGEASTYFAAFDLQCYFYQNGTFHPVKDIYESGMLSEQETCALCALSYAAKAAYRDEIPNVLERMEQEAVTATQNNNLDIPASNFYGVYNGYLIYYDYGDMAQIPEMSKPGKFMARDIETGRRKPLHDIYEAGKISREELERIYELGHLIRMW